MSLLMFWEKLYRLAYKSAKIWLKMFEYWGYAGDHVTLILTGPEQSSLAAGMVLCDPGTKPNMIHQHPAMGR